MNKPSLLLASAVSALALAGVVGAGVASADPTGTAAPEPAASPSAAAGAKGDHARRPHRGLTAKALHGEVTLAGKQHRLVQFQRGRVTTVEDSSVSVRSADGFVGTYRIESSTKIRVAHKKAALGDVEVGDRVRVFAAKDGSTLTATRLVDRRR